MNEKTHLDLFSGIGGFALAAKWNGYKTIGFCEQDKFCQAILKKHWPEVPIIEDIRQVRGNLYPKISLLTGGFPCQPFSVAGERRGKDDNRYLWPEMLRVIRETKPDWIIGENVAGIVNMALDQVHSDLEAEDYEVETIIIPACSVDASHRRDRCWIVAHSSRKQLEECFNLGGKAGTHSEPTGSDQGVSGAEHVADSIEQGREGWIQGRKNTERQSVEGHVGCGSTAYGQSRKAVWLPEPSMGRLAHGVPNRVARLKSLGNAIVPQVAGEIIRCINQITGE